MSYQVGDNAEPLSLTGVMEPFRDRRIGATR